MIVKISILHFPTSHQPVMPMLPLLIPYKSLKPDYFQQKDAWQ